ncbi:CYFIP-related Rac1 interactor B-like isoform X1 [Tachypleus tridentatus]|uniref:CYFIP-related Rac1 interactor B-like isoform X1 n=2 Tax=Tachypleus tridentatus TaxID=6853 RepID=UPI003FD39180
MGNLLKLLYRDETPKYDVFVDFENAKPSQSEMTTYSIVQEALKHSRQILADLRVYKGAGNEIKVAIGNPQNKQSQSAAWEAVIPLVTKLREFYEFSKKLEQVVPHILWDLCSGPMTPMQHLETQQALVKQFAEILDFVLEFDDLKMTNPAIQNDFSYYRRTVSRLRIANQDTTESEDLEVPNELANRMSLFYAHATPMLKVLSDATSQFVSVNKDLPVENTCETLGTMAKVCQRMVENPEFCSRFNHKDTILFVLRVMVGVVILYDHVHPAGAFVKTSHIDVKSCIKVLKEHPPELVESLLNALRYTTIHLNDESTPKHIRNMLQ